MRHNARDPRCECDDCWHVRRSAAVTYRRSYAYETGLRRDRSTADAEHGTVQRARHCSCSSCRDAANAERRYLAQMKREKAAQR